MDSGRGGQNAELVDPEMQGLRSRLMTVLQNSLRRDAYVGLDTIAIVCETIAADCKLNIWFLHVVKKHATEEQFMGLLERYNALNERCVTAVVRFHEDHDKNNLHSVIQEVATQMNVMQKTQFSDEG
jgi:hypothetical protein